LDVVSLFPKKTWRDRPNGLRPDLAEMLDAIKPSFVRFPGGCYVEGNKLANAFRWQESLGDIAGRPGHWSLWGYRSTDGLGYHEYLQLCEDLKAEPLFVINCGMAHEDHAPMAEMGFWVQGALDAIEYANGPATTKWGSLRAKNGHSEPFHLKYIEIGNENGGPLYDERYALIYDAIRAKYPKMQLIANVWNGVPGKRPVEIVDEHYYSSPDFFMAKANLYDAYDRKGPKVYVGEYAVTANCGQGNLKAAIAEAAFMTGMERNSDVVIMASYAPLFVNVGWRQWNPDAICFDNAKAFGTPSYYVQKMFSENRGDVVLPLNLTSPEVRAEAKGGAIGLATWATQAEFKDIKVTRNGKTLFTPPVNGMNGWTTLGPGQWTAQDGVVRQASNATDVRAVAGDKSWTNYTYSLKARKLSGAEGFLIMFRVQDNQAKSWWNLGGWNNTKHALELDGVPSCETPGRIETGRWYDIRVELTDASIRCYLDGKLLHDVQAKHKALYAVASYAETSKEVILKVANASNRAIDAPIRLSGASSITSAMATVLTSASPDDENSLKQPKKVAPTTRPIPGLDNGVKEFRHTFPAHSVSVLRLKTT
jgi:alpha-L-arabinofuranosidase